MTRADADRIRRREERRITLAIREHAYRSEVRAALERLPSLPHDSHPTLPPTGANAPESE